jgi:hypothetical protein
MYLVRTSQETLRHRYKAQPVKAVYCENHMERTNTLRGQNAEFWYVKIGGTYSNHWACQHLYCCGNYLYHFPL